MTTQVIRARQLVEQLDDMGLADWRGKSMLLTSDHSDHAIETLCAVAEALECIDRAGRKLPLFTNELNYAIFFDNSTRTKSSWAGAAARLGAHPVIVDGSSTQVAHGETAEETGAMLGMNAHALGIRHDLIIGEGQRFMVDFKKGIDDYLAASDDRRSVPIINLQCDVDHPTQSVADLLWLRQKFGHDLRGKTLAVSWAYSPSYAKPLSVPQGLITLLTRFGMNVRLAHPPGYKLIDSCVEMAAANAERVGGSFEIMHDMDAAFEGADIVYPKSWGPFDLMTERVAANKAGDSDELARIEARCLTQNAEYTDWICDERRMALTKGGEALYMHCLPADIGDEVSHAVLEKARTDLALEANKKVYGIMAMLAASKSVDLKRRLFEHLS